MYATVPITPEGFKRLTEELHRLKTVDRHAVIKEIAEARSHGDLSENAEYHAAKDKQSVIERRIVELEQKIAKAEVIDARAFSGERIRFGATVVVRDEDTGRSVTYRIVGEDEANVSAGLLSCKSLLARALIEKETGMTFDLVTPGGEKTYTITSVRYEA